MVLANGQRAGFFIGDGAGVGKGRQVSIFRICTISCCYYMVNELLLYCYNNQEWWPFSLGCKLTSFSWLQKHLPRFHFKTMWYHWCFPLPQPCETTQDLELLWHFINLWSLGRVWQLVQACKRTWLIVQPWKVLNSTTTVILKSPWIWFRSLKSTWFLY